ncbi:hypothetical protein CDIK_0786 [Cucumispora dikerogammari]|nr:hypothetical protein CDIK_0786 [Cucumispora dikerogammari]
MQLIIINNSNKIIFSKQIINETLIDIKSILSKKLNINKTKIHLYHENTLIINTKKPLVSLLNYNNNSVNNSIILSLKINNSIITKCMKALHNLINPSTAPSIMKVLTIIALFFNNNKVLATLIFIIYCLITLSNIIKFRLDSGKGSHLHVCGKVVGMFFASMFMIYSEEWFL